MPHVRTQLRNAIKSRLETVPGIRAAYNLSRIERIFQTQNFPNALVNLSEAVSPQPGGFVGQQPVTRTYRIDIQLGVLDVDDDPEAAVDALSVEVEKALIRPDFGIGKIQNWHLVGSGAGETAKIECGTVVSQVLTYTADIQTLDSAPDQNLHS